MVITYLLRLALVAGTTNDTFFHKFERHVKLSRVEKLHIYSCYATI